MKLESKPDDLCGNCGRQERHHAIRAHWSQTNACDEFVNPIVVRLVDALERHVKQEQADTDGTSNDDLNLLAECGRVVKDGDAYRWSEPPHA